MTDDWVASPAVRWLEQDYDADLKLMRYEYKCYEYRPEGEWVCDFIASRPRVSDRFVGSMFKIKLDVEVELPDDPLITFWQNAMNWNPHPVDERLPVW